MKNMKDMKRGSWTRFPIGTLELCRSNTKGFPGIYRNRIVV